LFFPLLLASIALADDSPAGLLPGAAPMAAGAREVGGEVGALGVVGFFGDGLRASPAAAGVLTVAPSDNLAVRLRAGGSLAFDAAPGAFATLEGRYVVSDLGGFRFAPWVAFAGVPETGVLGVAGAALEVGGERVVFDLSVPIFAGSVTAGAYEAAPLPSGGSAARRTVVVDGRVGSPAALTQLGVRWQVSGKDTLRVGLTSLAPTFGIRHDEERWFLDATVASLVAFNGARVGVGAKF
jgi:hypothetical protein